MNSKIIDGFNGMIHKINIEIKQTKNTALRFKISSYRKTIKIIKSLPFEINDGNDLKDIKGIGKTTIEKINEIIKTGTLKQLENLNQNLLTESKDIMNLQKITGIGPVKAKSLFKQGITLSTFTNIDFNNVSDEEASILDSLTHHQILGIKYFNDLESRIPYKEIEKIETFLLKLLKKHLPYLEMTICGSFRRKAKTSGDIDVLLYHECGCINDSDIKKSSYLTDFLELLIENDFLTDHLTSIDNKTKYMGFCKLLKLNRRIDIRLIPKKSLAPAMLYFTGSGDFNVNMRTYALTKGYTINEYGIYKVKPNGKKGFRIKTETEEDIFNVLKLDYVEPQNRLPSYIF